MTRSFGMIATAVEITLHAKALKHALIYTDSGNDASPRAFKFCHICETMKQPMT